MYHIDWINGQKTGFFIDQRENRTLLGRYATNKKYPESRCRDCDRARTKTYHKNNRDKVIKQQLISHRRRQYGISEEQYNNMILSQNNICAICNKPSSKTLHIDHDHETGKVRGLLCSSCNTAIGLFKEDIDSLSAAIKYLSSYQEEV